MADAASRPVNVFVTRDGNGFMRDIATWIVEAARVAGRTAALIDDRLPQPDGAINLVVAPHEFFLLRDDDDATIRSAARCSIPGTWPTCRCSTCSVRLPRKKNSTRLPSAWPRRRRSVPGPTAR